MRIIPNYFNLRELNIDGRNLASIVSKRHANKEIRAMVFDLVHHGHTDEAQWLAGVSGARRKRGKKPQEWTLKMVPHYSMHRVDWVASPGHYGRYRGRAPMGASSSSGSGLGWVEKRPRE